MLLAPVMGYHLFGRYGSFSDAMSSTNDRRVVKGSDCQAGQKTRPVTDPAAAPLGDRHRVRKPIVLVEQIASVRVPVVA